MKVDIVVYREKEFKEPWFLLVPSKMEDTLPTFCVLFSTFYLKYAYIFCSLRGFGPKTGGGQA